MARALDTSVALPVFLASPVSIVCSRRQPLLPCLRATRFCLDSPSPPCQRSSWHHDAIGNAEARSRSADCSSVLAGSVCSRGRGQQLEAVPLGMGTRRAAAAAPSAGGSGRAGLAGRPIWRRCPQAHSTSRQPPPAPCAASPAAAAAWQQQRRAIRGARRAVGVVEPAMAAASRPAAVVPCSGCIVRLAAVAHPAAAQGCVGPGLAAHGLCMPVPPLPAVGMLVGVCLLKLPACLRHARLQARRLRLFGSQTTLTTHTLWPSAP